MNKLRAWMSGRKLSTKLLLSALGSLLAAALVFALALTVGIAILDNAVYGGPSVERAADRQFELLQNFVDRENISSAEIPRLAGWTVRSGRVYVVVYRDGVVQYESTSGGQPKDPGRFDETQELAERLYTLRLSDGVEEHAYVYVYSSGAYYYLILALAAVLALVVFALCFALSVHGKFKYIRRLKSEVDILAGGQMNYPITVQGGDELGQLAAGIDEMRRSIVAHQQTEDEIRSANSQLVTAMSHDLRTPLTALMAYLELLDRGKVTAPEQQKRLIHQSLEQTASIRSMADKLFEYFFVYSSAWERPELEPVDADAVMSQFWQEYAFSLESGGYRVELDLQPIGGTIRIHGEMLRRVFDNLYANIVRYADKSAPVTITARREGGTLTVTVQNAVSPERDSIQGTNIGLGTCERILSYHNGTFAAEEHGGVFTVTMTLPVC